MQRTSPSSGALFAAAMLILCGACWCEDLRAASAPAAPPLRTTDDPRRVPLPPRDSAGDAVVVIANGTLIDGKGGPPIKRATVVLRGNQIVSAGAATTEGIPANARVIDAAGLYVLPGLIDLHLHFTGQRGSDFSKYRDSDAAAAIRGTLLAEQLVTAGITSVREPGTQSDISVRIRDAVQRGMIKGPRIFWSGRIIVSRGGHGDEITATATDRPKSYETSPRYRVATGPWDWRLAVREQAKMHADWLKVTAPYTREEIGAAVDEAHMLGLPIAAHSFGKYTLWAVEAGVDTIEHPLDLADGVIAAMGRQKTAWVPTLVTYHKVLTEGYPSAGIPRGGFFFTMSARFPMTHERHLENVRTAHRQGVAIGVGTDVPFDNERNYPGAYFEELSFLRDAGLSNEEALAAATRVGAEILKMGDRLGTIEPGKLADLIVVDGSPLEDIQNLRNVRYVIQDGRVMTDR